MSAHVFIIHVEHLVARASLTDKPPTLTTSGADSWTAALATVVGGLFDVLELLEVVVTIPTKGGASETSVAGESFDLLLNCLRSGTVPDASVGTADSADHSAVRDSDFVLGNHWLARDWLAVPF